MKRIEDLSELNGVRLRVGGTLGAGWTAQNVKTGRFMSHAAARKLVSPVDMDAFFRQAIRNAMTRMAAAGKKYTPPKDVNLE